MPIKMEGGGHFWKTLVHEKNKCAWKDFSIKSWQSNRAHSHKSFTDQVFFYSPLLSDSSYTDIIQNKTIWKQGQKENMRRWFWLLIREWLGRAAFTTAKPNRNQHMLLCRLDLFLLCLISAFSYPYMAANVCSACLEEWESKGDYCILPTCSDTSSAIVFSSTNAIYIAHTLVSLVPGNEKHDCKTLLFVTPLSWSKLNSISRKHTSD